MTTPFVPVMIRKSMYVGFTHLRGRGLNSESKTQPYFLKKPSGGSIPVLISVPHCGTEIPDETKPAIEEKFLRDQPDTDWLVHELYSFAGAIGATLIHARYSRYVIDLNRDPAGGTLYSDGRRETTLIPRLTFDGETIYKANRYPDATEVSRRIYAYHQPYYDAIGQTLAEFKQKHKHVLFFDAHSIKRLVKSISAEPFPDMILGSKDGSSAAQELIDTALLKLNEPKVYSISHNSPFKGGQLTRHFGRPRDRIHALQLEMSQDVYLQNRSDGVVTLDPAKGPKIQSILRSMIEELAKTLTGLQ